MRVSEIDEKILSTFPSVSRKIKQIEEDNIIKGYVGIVDNYNLGKHSRAVFLITISEYLDSSEITDRLTDTKDV